MTTVKRFIVWLSRHDNISTILLLLTLFVVSTVCIVDIDRTVWTRVGIDNLMFVFLCISAFVFLVLRIFINNRGEYWGYAVNVIWEKRLESFGKNFPDVDTAIFVYAKNLPVKERERWLYTWERYTRTMRSIKEWQVQKSNHEKEAQKINEKIFRLHERMDDLKSQLFHYSLPEG
ncbi:MAG: hypothetical protein HGA67_01895 [Candidatus Yonathbacteria bacterium]|nr:hypothetical protein [Candidatus Yonathbacteria bacterium]